MRACGAARPQWQRCRRHRHRHRCRRRRWRPPFRRQRHNALLPPRERRQWRISTAAVQRHQHHHQHRKSQQRCPPPSPRLACPLRPRQRRLPPRWEASRAAYRRSRGWIAWRRVGIAASVLEHNGAPDISPCASGWRSRRGMATGSTSCRTGWQPSPHWVCDGLQSRPRRPRRPRHSAGSLHPSQIRLQARHHRARHRRAGSTECMPSCTAEDERGQGQAPWHSQRVDSRGVACLCHALRSAGRGDHKQPRSAGNSALRELVRPTERGAVSKAWHLIALEYRPCTQPKSLQVPLQ